MRKSQLLLLPPDDTHTDGTLNGGVVGGDGCSESYSSNSSFTESYSDSSDLANWEEYVAENGTLFYAEYSLQARRSHEKRIEFSRSSSLRMGKKSAAAVARKQQQQQLTKGQAHATQKFDDFKFSHIRHRGAPEQQQKQLELVITAADRYRFGRRSTAVESILGFRVVPFSDQPECLMVNGFVHDMPAMQQQQPSQVPPIKRGDWFKSLDDIEVRSSNIDELLLQFVEPTKVCLKFQGPAADADNNEHGRTATGATSGEGNAAGRGNDLLRIENFAMFTEAFERLELPATMISGEMTPAATDFPTARKTNCNAAPFLFLILPPECYQSEQHKDSLFYYPELGGTNFLYRSRGSFLTLNAVLSAEMLTKPSTSKMLVDDVQYYVCFRTLNSFLVLFAYAATYQSSFEANLRSDELINYIRFALPGLTLENFSNNNEASTALRQFLQQFCTIQRVRLLARQVTKEQQRHTVSSHRQCVFEELLKESCTLPLPKEAQLRIFDALSEMEAMDYRNWNDEPLNTHREFFIHGSVLYYDRFLLAAQMPLEMRASVEGFLRCRGILDFIAGQCVKELYIWEEIVPPDCESGRGAGRYFLTVCSRSHLILAVVLKIFDAPDLAQNATVSPSLFYIEEIQETLDHLISCGIESLAKFWSISNKRPEVLDSLESMTDEAATVDKESNKLETFIKQKLTPSVSGITTASSTQSQRNICYDEETHLCSSLGGSSIHSLAQSEDDSSRKRLTGTSNDNVSDSGSDWDNFGEQNPLHCGLDTEVQSQMTESLWKEINNVVPVKISAGCRNAVFYYVYVDSANSTVFYPLKATAFSNNNHGNNVEVFPFMHEMRKACHVIHNVLQNTKNFRRQLAQEPITAKSSTAATSTTTTAAIQSTSRFMGLAIKEHGLTIQIRDTPRAGTIPNDVENSNNTAQTGMIKGSFVVVGRLFHSPTREIYICHHPDVPQNMVEMAFRLSFFSVG